MSALSRELVFLVLQFLEEEKFEETVHKLEQESGFFFNIKHFEDLVLAGEWEEVEKYLGGFTKIEDNRYSMKMFFEIRKQKYLEALDRSDRAKGCEILMKDLKVFASLNEDVFNEMTQLLALENFRQNEHLSRYGDTNVARSVMALELNKLIQANPVFRDKLTYPSLKASRLRSLINQSLNWQHQLCQNPRPNPDIKTLFTDHSCSPTSGARAPPPINSQIIGSHPKSGAFSPVGAHYNQVVAPPASSAAGWNANANSSTAQSMVAQGPAPGLVQAPNTAGLLKRTTPSVHGIDYQTADSENIQKRMRTSQSNEASFASSSHLPNTYSQDELPRTLVRTLNQGSQVMSLDFHPQQQMILLVGTNIGDISLWEVGSRERIAYRSFKVWETSACSMPLQAALVKDSAISVNRCLWSPDGSIIGVAFSKHLVHIYAFLPTGDLQQRLEIDAHMGGVNDIAFSHPNKTLSIITCGDDKTIKVWDVATGQRQYVFEGHEASVYSVCPHSTEAIPFIFSTSIDGKIKAWLYNHLGSRVDYDSPGSWCTRLAYSSDGTRVFSCGTNKEGDSFLVEWSEAEGVVKRIYSGFRRQSLGVVQFDTTKNRYLAAGDEFMIKFWDMNNSNILTTMDAEGGLPARPRLRFNKEGSLLAVSTSENGIKILANADGQRLIRILESRIYESSRGQSKHGNMKTQIVNTVGVVPNVSGSSTSVPERSDRMLPAVSMGSLTTMGAHRIVDVKPRISDLTGMDAHKIPDVKPRISSDSPTITDANRITDVKPIISNDAEKIKTWTMMDIVDFAHLKALKLPDSMTTTSKVVRLLYTNSGRAVLALGSNAVHKLWKWQRTDRNLSGKSTASITPYLWQPTNGNLMINEVNDGTPTEGSSACLALCTNDSYAMSTSGGKIFLFNMTNFKVMTTFMSPPPRATVLAFHPQDNNIIAIGMEDSTIQIYNVRVAEVIRKLKGHQKKITGLAFSHSLLVSSGADTQLCVWSIDNWEKKQSRFIQVPAGISGPLVGDTTVQFHNDRTRVLVVHEGQLSICNNKLECLTLWSPRESLSAPISSGVYSCNGLLVYAGFRDGAIGIFDADSLKLQCRIAPSAYLSPNPSNGTVHPLVIAAHPSDPSQIALGMSNGSVYVVEPSDAERKLKAPVPPQDNRTLPSVASNPALDSQTPDPPPTR